jgi:hypothetical protein
MSNLPEDFENGLTDHFDRFLSEAWSRMRGEFGNRAVTEPETEAEPEPTEPAPVAPWVEAVGENVVKTPLFGCAMVIVGIAAAAEWIRGLFKE